MGFSLSGFGAGIAEGITERIEEERKFSNLALQGRIERASVLRQQREREEKALEEELRGRRDELIALGVAPNSDEMKAYLATPTAAEALKKIKFSERELGGAATPIDPKEFIKINKDILPVGTVDDMIKNMSRRQQENIQPAKITPTEGGSMFAPSADAQQRRLEQLASARGLTLTDVARAESAPSFLRPQAAASINFEALKREKDLTPDQELNVLMGKAAKLAADPNFGPKHPDTIAATARYNLYSAAVESLTPEQFDHNKKLNSSLAIMLNPNSNVSPERKAEARTYVKNYIEYKKSVEANRQQNDRIAPAATMATLLAKAGNSAVEITFGARAGKDFAFKPIDPNNPQGEKYLAYTGTDPDMQAQITRVRQQGALDLIKAERVVSNGAVTDVSTRMALGTLGVRFDDQNKPILIQAPPPVQPPPGTDSTSNRPGARTAPAPARPGASAPTPAAPARTPAPPSGGFPPGSTIDAKPDETGKRKVYDASGKHIGYGG